MRGQVLAAVSALAVAFTAAAPTVAWADNYPTYHDEHVANQRECERSRNNRTTGGAVIGGVIGALLGREVADRGVRGEGAALGAVVGAVAGGAIGRNSANCDSVPQGSYDPYDGRRYGRDDSDGRDYRRDDDLYGGPYEETGYGRDDRYGRNDRYSRNDRECRMGEVITRDPYGREYRDNVWMCRGRDGVWREQ